VRLATLRPFTLDSVLRRQRNAATAAMIETFAVVNANSLPVPCDP
jgi:hypothetical protein